MLESNNHTGEALPPSSRTLTLAAAGVEMCVEARDLTTRQLEILELVVAGHPSKNIAADLGIGPMHSREPSC